MCPWQKEHTRVSTQRDKIWAGAILAKPVTPESPAASINLVLFSSPAPLSQSVTHPCSFWSPW